MSRPFLFLYGNCQMERIAAGLRSQPALKRAYEVRVSPNFRSFDDIADPRHGPKIDYFQANAANTSVFIYQAEAWDKNAAVILDVLPADCRRIPIFSVSLSTFWPFYFKDVAIRKARSSDGRGHYFPYGDTYLSRAVKSGGEVEAIAAAYSRLDIDQEVGLEAWRAANFALLRQKEAAAVVKVADFIEARFQAERMFWTPNHPTNPVFRLMVAQLLAVLGFPDLDVRTGDGFSDNVGFGRLLHHPVHPGVIAHYGLGYLTPDTIYKHFDDALDFQGWVRRYIATAAKVYGPSKASAA